MSVFSKYLPQGLVSLLTIRICVYGATFGEALAVLSIAGLIAYRDFLATKEISIPTEKLKEEIKAEFEETKKEIDKVRGELTSMSIAVSQKPKSNPITHRF